MSMASRAAKRLARMYELVCRQCCRINAQRGGYPPRLHRRASAALIETLEPRLLLSSAIYEADMSADPGWSLDGLWEWGVPQGGGVRPDGGVHGRERHRLQPRRRLREWPLAPIRYNARHRLLEVYRRYIELPEATDRLLRRRGRRGSLPRRDELDQRMEFRRGHGLRCELEVCADRPWQTSPTGNRRSIFGGPWGRLTAASPSADGTWTTYLLPGN